MRFPAWLLSTTYCPVWLQSCFPLTLSLPQPQDLTLCSCAWHYFAECSNGILLRSLNSLTPMQPSLLWPPALWISTCLVPHIPLHLLNSGSPVFPLSVLWPENTLKAMSWGHHWTHTVSFPSLKGHCPSLPDAQYFPHNSSCFLVVSHGRVHPARYSILFGNRNCKSIFNFLKFPNLFFKLHIWIYELRIFLSTRRYTKYENNFL